MTTIGITFGTFDLFHAGHILMLQEAKNQCDHLIVCIQTDPSIDRPDSKNKPVQSIIERQIAVEACRYVDQTLIYETESQVMEILNSIHWDVRILGAEYKDKPFTGRAETLDKCYFNHRQHQFSSSGLRQRVIDSGKVVLSHPPDPLSTPNQL